MPGYTRILACAALVFIFSACQSNLEPVEARNDYGQMERYTRRKTDFAREGLYQRFHEKGYLLEEAHFVNDTLDGVRTFYYPDGHIERISHYRRGVVHGPSK
ncbi:MAG: hypothetical protein IPM81_03350 [Saprospirales bacterium]|nr:hypothetical protein [Saprospirales bacterium]